MTTELTVLALAALLQCAQFVAMAALVNLEVGPGKTMSPRDAGRPGGQIADLVSPRTGRLIRALNNHFEALILFTIAVTVLTLADKSTGLSGILAWVYLGARVLYVPAYYFGLTPWRSLIWSAGWAATVLMILSALV